MEALALREHEFESCYTNYHPIMSKVAYYKTGNRDDAEDICQELFLKFYENLDTIRDKKNWLNTVLKNMICTYYTKNTDYPELMDYSSLEEQASRSIFDNDIETSMILEEIFENCELLDNDIDKQIFYLSVFDNKSYNEIGRLLNLTKKQIHYRVDRLRFRVQYQLKMKGINNCEDLL